MSTHATVTQKTDDGYRSIYVHFDGYYSGVGHTLFHHYNTAEKVKQLIDLGDCSVLAPTLENSVFYHRDRGESFKDVAPEEVDDVYEVNLRGDYNYLYQNSQWFELVRSSQIKVDRKLTKKLVGQ